LTYPGPRWPPRQRPPSLSSVFPDPHLCLQPRMLLPSRGPASGTARSCCAGSSPAAGRSQSVAAPGGSGFCASRSPTTNAGKRGAPRRGEVEDARDGWRV
jgi:hypothetical protein